MVVYDQKEFCKASEGTVQKEIVVGNNAAMLKLTVENGGEVQCFSKLFKDSKEFPLAGIDNSSYAPVTTFTQGSYSIEISGFHKVIILSKSANVSIKTVY